ncbi:MAG: 30S ribosomal protein S21 [Bacteroidetes bacterium]|nr:30S ribosomal protein S21 [Bacteroidota bacterium]
MIGVTLQKSESIDRVLKRFKRKYEKAGILREYKGRTAFVKPSIEKRQQRIRAARKQYKISKEMSK